MSVEYDPPFRFTPSSYVSGGEHWVTRTPWTGAILDLVAAKGRCPGHIGTTGDFRISPVAWVERPGLIAVDLTIGELVRDQLERHKAWREEEASQPPYQPPPAETLGLWSLIANGEATRFRQLLEQHPALANEPLPIDESDKYSHCGAEYAECYPLMLATEYGSVEVAQVLLELDADPKQRNRRGETALHFASRSSDMFEEVASIVRMLCERGADPEAKDSDGKTPLTSGLCAEEIAEVLVEFGARPTLHYALGLGMLDWSRRELRDNPNAVRDDPYSALILETIGFLIRTEAERRHGRELRLAKGDTPSADDDEWTDTMAYSQAMGFRVGPDGSYLIDGKLALWRRHAEVERAVFDEYRDLLDSAHARGADPDAGSALFYAAHMLDTSLAEWLLTHGADPNRDIKQGTALYMLDFAQTRRMIDLLHRFGAMDNPYTTRATDEWDERRNCAMSLLKDQFD